MSNFAPGVVAVSADEAGRYTQFAMSMSGLRLPVGTLTRWLIGNDFAGNRNVAVDSLLESDAEWLWFIDDDHAFSPELVMGLLDDLSDDVHIVAPVVLRRAQPFTPVANIDGVALDLASSAGHGLVEVDETGTAGMLIRREAIIDIVESSDGERLFQLEDGVSEDYVFCRKAQMAGYSLYVDLGLRMGHITTCAIWPAWDGAQWLTGFTVGDGFKLAADLQVESVL